MKEVRERDIHHYDILYVDSKIWQIRKKIWQIEPIYETESQTQVTVWWLPRGRGVRGLDWQFGISRCKLVIYIMDKQQGLTVQHGELY